MYYVIYIIDFEDSINWLKNNIQPASKLKVTNSGEKHQHLG